MSDTEPEVPPVPLPPAPVPPVEPAPPAPPAAPAAPGYVAPPAPGYAPGSGYAALPPVRSQGLAITSLILGIVSIVFFFFLLSLPAGIAALITGLMARTRQPWARGLWITGIITGAIGILLGLIIGVVIIAGIAGAFNDSMYDY